MQCSCQLGIFSCPEQLNMWTCYSLSHSYYNLDNIWPFWQLLTILEIENFLTILTSFDNVFKFLQCCKFLTTYTICWIFFTHFDKFDSGWKAKAQNISFVVFYLCVEWKQLVLLFFSHDLFFLGRNEFVIFQPGGCTCTWNAQERWLLNGNVKN